MLNKTQEEVVRMMKKVKTSLDGVLHFNPSDHINDIGVLLEGIYDFQATKRTGEAVHHAGS
jgi:hypothetical protein